MRVSREVAARNRERVVETAGREFRAHGYDGIGVAGLMKAAGLTHGGFYKQFEDKEALATESTRQALAENLENWRKVIGSKPEDPLGALARWYLSPAHRARLSDGCAYAALAAEAPRHDAGLRSVFEEALERSVVALAAAAAGAETGTEIGDADGRSTAEDPARKRALRAIATMVGALVLARAVDDESFAAEILEAGRAAVSGDDRA